MKKCSKCGEDVRSLLDHRREVHFLACDHPGCGRRFASEYHLQTHVKSKHETIARFPCPHIGCKEVFGNKRMLRRHRRTHALSVLGGVRVSRRPDDAVPRGATDLPGALLEDDDFGDAFTDDRFVGNYDDDGVTCRHMGCGQRLRNARARARHEAQHKRVDELVCPELGCGRSFHWAQHLRDHQTMHSAKAYACEKPNCGKSYKWPGSLRRHMREAHAPRLACPYPGCAATFRRRDWLLEHAAKTHGGGAMI